MSEIVIFHNPRCSKSRQALSLITAQGITPKIRLYLEDAPNAAEITELLGQLNLSIEGVLRRTEEAYKAHFKGITDEAKLLDLLVEHPKVLERPIIIKGQKAVIGRPPEAVLALLSDD